MGLSAQAFRGMRRLKETCARHAAQWALSVLAFALALPASAQKLPQGFTLPSPPPGLPQGKLPDLIARVIQAALGLTAVIALGFIVYGGFRYIISRGDEGEVKQAKDIITYAVIGLVVIGLAFAIVQFVIFGVLNDGGR